MKKTIISITAFLAFFLGNHPTNAQTQDDREFLLNYFEKTADGLKNSIQGLSPEQMHYQPADGEWSVAQCVEHIIMTEGMLFEMTKELLEKPANPERKAEIKTTNEQLIAGVTDRSHKAQAPKMLLPKGKYERPEVAFRDFMAQREKILSFFKKVTMEELHNHIDDTPVGPADAYQSVLFIAGHTARHTLQIDEVKASKDFPKE